MQELGEPCRSDDDMADGDLGDGMRTASLKKSLNLVAPLDSSPLRPELRLGSRHTEARRIPSLKVTASQWKVPCLDSLADWSKDKLKEKLQEAVEVIDALCCELEVTHRYLEGKYEALKILQGKAILDRATSHTKSLLQKSEEKNKALEKEVNSLQWELSFLQLQAKKSEQCWEHKYNRTVSENESLTERLDKTQNQVQQLGAENSVLRRQYLELLSMLNVREQRIYQGTKPQYCPERDASMLELAVLGACRCSSVQETCACSRTAAASRKQLVRLQQELDAQRSRMQEAVMVADAYRIAFEQQLRKRNEHFLLLAEANVLKPGHCRAEGVPRSPLLSVGQKLRGLLPSSLDMRTPEELLETLYRLLDLLNDKEEALAHQRKVSIMLAHSADELQKQLHLDEPSEPSDSVDTLENPSEGQSQETSGVSSQSNVHTEPEVELKEAELKDASSHTESGTQAGTESLQPGSKPVFNQENHESCKKQENLENTENLEKTENLENQENLVKGENLEKGENVEDQKNHENHKNHSSEDRRSGVVNGCDF